MRTASCFLLPLSLALTTASGCDGGEKTPGDTAAADTDTDADGDADGDADSDADADTGESPYTSSLSGVILDPDGAPASGVRVNVCRSLCKTTTTSADGSYSFSGLESWTASFYVQANPDLAYATPFAPVTWAENEAKTIDIRLVAASDSQPVGRGAEYDFGEGLAVVMESGDVVDYLSGDPIEEISITAAPEDARPPIELADEIVLGVYYLAPFEAHGEAQLKVQNVWALPTGAAINVWYGEEPLDSVWTLGGTLTVTDGEWLDGTASVAAFTTVVVSYTDVVDE